jgi:stearoyl-CoA desaturase (delta-9 desaturase)
MDVHSPEREGFWWSHVGWILSSKYEETDFNAIKDFAKYPELRWLNRFHVIPAVVWRGLFPLMGWQGLVWGFFIGTVLLYHGTLSSTRCATCLTGTLQDDGYEPQ